MSEPTITYERREAPHNRDFKVLIDGEHRATFHSNHRYHQTGYDLKAKDGKHIAPAYRSWKHINKADFEQVVRDHLKDIPTVADIERALMIYRAENENREWNDARDRHNKEIRQDVLCRALELYLDEDQPTDEERAMALKLLTQYRSQNCLL